MWVSRRCDTKVECGLLDLMGMDRTRSINHLRDNGFRNAKMARKPRLRFSGHCEPYAKPARVLRLNLRLLIAPR